METVHPSHHKGGTDTPVAARPDRQPDRPRVLRGWASLEARARRWWASYAPGAESNR